jgi:hypothetical protein
VSSEAKAEQTADSVRGGFSFRSFFPDSDYAWFLRATQRKDAVKVGVQGYNDPAIGNRPGDKDLVGSGLEADFPHMNRVKAAGAKEPGRRTGKTLIKQQPHRRESRSFDPAE